MKKNDLASLMASILISHYDWESLEIDRHEDLLIAANDWVSEILRDWKDSEDA